MKILKNFYSFYYLLLTFSLTAILSGCGLGAKSTVIHEAVEKNTQTPTSTATATATSTPLPTPTDDWDGATPTPTPTPTIASVTPVTPTGIKLNLYGQKVTYGRGLHNKLTLSISGVVSGLIVQVFATSMSYNALTNSNPCTATSAVKVGEAVATSDSFDMVVGADQNLLANKNNFFARTKNAQGNVSACSNNVVAYYDKKSCPDQYVAVYGNEAVMTEGLSSTGNMPYDFCVMKYEAKSVTNDPAGKPVAKTRMGLTPYLNENMDIYAAQTYCKNNGPGYHLVTNQEWMSMARDIETVATNWTRGVVGQGMLANGNALEPDIYPAGEDSNGFYAMNVGADGSNKQKRRTLYFSADETHNPIWDLSGNVAEYVSMSPIPGDDDEIHQHLRLSQKCGASNGGGIVYGDPANILCDDTLTLQKLASAKYINNINNISGLGNGWAQADGRTVVRGGSHAESLCEADNGNTVRGFAGIYAMFIMDESVCLRKHHIGFRCAYIPQ